MKLKKKKNVIRAIAMVVVLLLLAGICVMFTGCEHSGNTQETIWRSDNMKFIVIILAILVVVGYFYFTATPTDRAFRNNLDHTLHKIDDAAPYKTRKQVEDICRTTIVSYEFDKLTWEQHKDSEDEEQRGWANAAKIKANKTALFYNEYFLKNSYVFEGNVPADIWRELEIIK